MALVKCPECGTDVSSLAGTCPKCAAPISQLFAAEAAGQRTVAKAHVGVSILLTVLGLVLAGTSAAKEGWSLAGTIMTLAGIVWFLAARRRFNALQKTDSLFHRDEPVEGIKGGQTMSGQISAAEDPGQVAALKKKLGLESRFRNGINGFYWIAGLSILNTVSYLSGSKFGFVIGLGATQFVDAFMGALSGQFAQAATLIRGVGVVIDLIIAGVFVLFGYLGRKQKRGMIIAGMILYAADAVLLAAFKDFLGTAFHAWVLMAIAGGLKALGQLQALGKPQGSDVIGTVG